MKNKLFITLLAILIIDVLSPTAFAYQQRTRIWAFPITGTSGCKAKVIHSYETSNDYVKISNCKTDRTYSKNVYPIVPQIGLTTWSESDTVGGEYYSVDGYAWDNESGKIYLIIPLALGFLLGLIIATVGIVITYIVVRTVKSKIYRIV